MAYSHGSNDAQKTMGIITMALVAGGYLHTFNVPVWVIILCALTMAAGTAGGGNIVMAWVIIFPACAVMAWGFYEILFLIV